MRDTIFFDSSAAQEGIRLLHAHGMHVLVRTHIVPSPRTGRPDE